LRIKNKESSLNIPKTFLQHCQTYETTTDLRLDILCRSSGRVTQGDTPESPLHCSGVSHFSRPY